MTIPSDAPPAANPSHSSQAKPRDIRTWVILAIIFGAIGRALGTANTVSSVLQSRESTPHPSNETAIAASVDGPMSEMLFRPWSLSKIAWGVETMDSTKEGTPSGTARDKRVAEWHRVLRGVSATGQQPRASGGTRVAHGSNLLASMRAERS